MLVNVSANEFNTFGKGLSERSINGGNDEYFTRTEVARKFIRKIKRFTNKNSIYIEPSAGNGTFVEILQRKNKIIAFDINPKHPSVLCKDWFSVDCDYINSHLVDSSQQKVVVGNPPFGFSANLAIKFFNHASNFADVIAFILPRSFQKDSIKNKLNPLFHLKHEYVLDRNESTFSTGDGLRFVPCVWQIWVKKDIERKIVNLEIENPWIHFVDKYQATHAIRRVGGRAGQVLDGLNHSKSTTYFIIEKVSGVVDYIRQEDFSNIVNATSGVKSLSKRELVGVLNRRFNNA